MLWEAFNLNAKSISMTSPWFDLLGVQSEMDRCSFWKHQENQMVVLERARCRFQSVCPPSP